VARSLKRMPGGAMLIGKSAAMLVDGLRPTDLRRPVGAIAGRLPLGLGAITGSLAAPHDGTVSVAETEFPGLTDHCVVAATHFGLVFSEDAAQQTLAFLRNARFERGAPVN